MIQEPRKTVGWTSDMVRPSGRALFVAKRSQEAFYARISMRFSDWKTASIDFQQLS